MISYDEALALVLAEATPIGTEEVSLTEAQGRRLAGPMIAAIDAPRADVSVMDGYAVRDADLAGPLTVIGESWPGRGFSGELRQGECVRIFTGAPIPSGCDRVVMQEQADRDGQIVRLNTDPSAARFIRKRASDFAAGDELAGKGRRVDARLILAAAGADLDRVTVWRRPRVAILATGDELVEPGTAREAAEAVPDSVSYGVAAMVAEWGGELVLRERLLDNPVRISKSVTNALDDSDLIIITGGASVGEKDFALAALDAAGMTPIFAKARMKPGKPVWFGRVGQRLILGLPGNPVSAMVCARLFMAPLLTGMSGGKPEAALRWRSALLSAALPPCGDRETFTRGRGTDAGVEPLTMQDSGAQRSLADADLLIRQRPGDPAKQSGEQVEMLDL